MNLGASGCFCRLKIAYTRNASIGPLSSAVLDSAISYSAVLGPAAHQKITKCSDEILRTTTVPTLNSMLKEGFHGYTIAHSDPALLLTRAVTRFCFNSRQIVGTLMGGSPRCRCLFTPITAANRTSDLNHLRRQSET